MKGRHRPAQRVVLPNGMWVLLYDDGSLKLAGYDRKLQVTEVLNRDGGAHIFVRVQPVNDAPKNVAPRPSDLVTVARRVMMALERVRR